jgi:uncharacterized protein YuzE
MMQFHFDEEANALYSAIAPGEVARTVELTDLVYVDVDAQGAPLGIEFVSADEFVPFLRRLNALDQDHQWRELVPSQVLELFSVGAA